MTYIRFMEDKIVTKPPITKSVCVLWGGRWGQDASSHEPSSNSFSLWH